MKSCCICKKKIVRNNGPFFHIPKEEWRRSKWIAVCQRQFSATARICADHFLPTDFIKGAKRNWLMPSAVPSLQLRLEDLIPKSLTEVPLVVPEAVVIHKNRRTQTHLTMLENRLEKYKAMNKNLQVELEKLKLQVAVTSQLTTFMRTIFTEGQMRKIMSPEKVEWSRNDISRAIRLHASGPKAYDYLIKNGFPLPPVSTLELWCRKVIIDEGFLITSLGFIKHCTELTSEDKLCVIVLGEMEVVQTYENNSELHSKRKQADYVQVVMAQGLWKSWKCPVFFDFDCQMRKHVLFSIIAKLNRARFPVVAVVCDIGPTYRKLLEDLDVTADKPWFPNPTNPKEKVFTFVDGSHLLELIRNNFLATGLMWNNELLTSRSIAYLIERTSKNDISAAYELSDENNLDQSVGGQKFAAQLFSKATVEALRHSCSTGINLYKPHETADFIQLVIDWFDVLNSSIDSFTTTGKEPFGIALVEQQLTLMRMNKFMSSDIVPKKTALEYFQEGVIITNTALVLLHDYIKQKFSMSYILTSRINQKELRQLFGAIQRNVGFNDQLTPQVFKNNLRNYIMDQNLQHLNNTTNESADSSSSTMSLHEITADCDSDVLDELDRTNYNEVGTFVDIV